MRHPDGSMRDGMMDNRRRRAMNTPRMRTRFVIGLGTLVVAAFSGPRTGWAAGVVGTGTAASCTEAALDSALSAGGAYSRGTRAEARRAGWCKNIHSRRPSVPILNIEVTEEVRR